MSVDPLLEKAVDELVIRHGCHTVVLYGSRARGAQTEASDYDLVGFREGEPSVRDARWLDGAYLDAFVYPERALATPLEFLHVRGGRVMVQQGDLGDALLAAVEAAYRQGPEAWPDDQREAARAWAYKTLSRIARGDVEGHFRRAWLIRDLLEDYFRARDLWYEGPKASFAWLEVHDLAVYQAFEAAVAPGAGLAEAEALVSRVWDS